MKLSRQPGSALPDRSSNTSPQVFLDLFRNASSQTLAWTAVAVAVAWVPVAVLSALRGGGAFPSFLTDYAMQSRLLIIIPVLILSAPALHERRSQVAQHIETFLVPRNQYPKFHDDWTSNDELRNSWFARILIVALVYVTVIWLDRYLSPNGAEFTGWWKGGGGLRFMSPAGTWAAFVSYPVALVTWVFSGYGGNCSGCDSCGQRRAWIFNWLRLTPMASEVWDFSKARYGDNCLSPSAWEWDWRALSPIGSFTMDRSWLHFAICP